MKHDLKRNGVIATWLEDENGKELAYFDEHIQLIKGEKEVNTKEMPIIEVSKQLKHELDRLDILFDTNEFYKSTGESRLDKEVQNIVNKYDEFTFKSQVVMYLVSTKNYVAKADPTYYVLYGLFSKQYYVEKDDFPLETNVYIAQYKNKQQAQDHADDLNLFVEGK